MKARVKDSFSLEETRINNEKELFLKEFNHRTMSSCKSFIMDNIQHKLD